MIVNTLLGGCSRILRESLDNARGLLAESSKNSRRTREEFSKPARTNTDSNQKEARSKGLGEPPERALKMLNLPSLAGRISLQIFKLRIDIISVLPELLESSFSHSILKRAKEKDLLEIFVHPLRKWAVNEYGQVDDYQYGGGAGMVMMCEPLANAIESLNKERTYDEIIFMSPDGELLNQPMANALSLNENLLIISGHYKGIDERIREHFITREISIGDYVLSGGELPAAVLTDAIGRLLPGVLNDETSALFDSFQDNLLAPPVYTRPSDFRGWKVPEILLSGDPIKIAEWRHEAALRKTSEKRPGLLDT